MAYWNNKTGKNNQALDNFGWNSGRYSIGNQASEFYEFEPGIVLDIIMDEDHYIFKNNEVKIDVDRWLGDLSDKKPSNDDIDYSWIGRALVRPIISQKATEKEELTWAIPIECNMSEFPLINELVVVVRYFNKMFYSKVLNFNNFINTNADFNMEILYGGYTSNGVKKGNKEFSQ